MEAIQTYKYEYKYKYLAEYQNNHGFLSRTNDLSTHRLLTMFTVPCIYSPLGASLKFKQKVIGYHHNSHAAVEKAGASYLTGWHCGMQDPALDKTTDVFSLPADHIVPSSTVKASQPGRTLLVKLG